MQLAAVTPGLVLPALGTANGAHGGKLPPTTQWRCFDLAACSEGYDASPTTLPFTGVAAFSDNLERIQTLVR